MKVRKLADCVARALVDRSGDLAPLNMGDTDVHVGRCDGGSESFVAVADHQYHVRFEPLKFTGELDNAEPDGLRHGGRGGTFQLDVNLAVDWETVLPDNLDRLVEALEHHGAGSQHL